MIKASLPFMWLAGAGFVLSLLVHLACLAEIAIPGGESVFTLHVGVFLVWLPTVLVMMTMTRGATNRDLWKVALAGAQPWMRAVVYGAFLYGIVNFILFASGAGAHAATGVAEPSLLRVFSGNWLTFYSAAFATLYSARQRPDLLEQRRCSRGHLVSANAVFCETCGEPLAAR